MTPPPIRRAATVLVLRPDSAAASTGRPDVEVLFVRRGARASFMANAYVFPGGRIDEADSAGLPADSDLGARRAAARELSEEAALTVADLDELVPFARWITPAAEPKRFDADFFLWALPPDQSPRVDEQEVFDLRWYTPTAALAEYEAGALNLPPPTACTLEDLRAEVAALGATGPTLPAERLPERLLASGRRRRPWPVMPRLAADASGSLSILMPWDPDFPTTDAGEAAVAAPMALAEGAAPVPRRICRCTLVPPGTWRIQRRDG